MSFHSEQILLLQIPQVLPRGDDDPFQELVRQNLATESERLALRKEGFLRSRNGIRSLALAEVAESGRQAERSC